MANSIALAKQYVEYLDEVYKLASLTSVLDGPSELIRAGQNAEEICIPKLSMDGQANYSRNSGFVAGDVTLTYETVKCTYDRGRMFQVDVLDNEETMGVAFGRLAGEYIRTKVAPELDAWRFARYAGTASIGTTTAAALSAGANVVAAIRVGLNAMGEGEVPETERYLFITPTLLDMIADLDTTKSRDVLAHFAGIIRVPQSRFYTGIVLNDGSTSGQTGGGFAKDTTNSAKDINFMIIHKPAVIQYQKHTVPKVVSPEQNQNADAWKFGYRTVGIADVYDNKVAGVYLHKKNS